MCALTALCWAAFSASLALGFHVPMTMKVCSTGGCTWTCVPQSSMLFGWVVIVLFRRGGTYIVCMCWVGECVRTAARQHHAIRVWIVFACNRVCG